MQIGDTSPIKYVFYIIKENRTYDQVLGDMKEGNGDTSLGLFGEKITPNLHALAKEFVLLDNFYVDAEVSADGHNWSMGAYATDYLEKTWPTGYGDRGGTMMEKATGPSPIIKVVLSGIIVQGQVLATERMVNLLMIINPIFPF